MYYRIQNTGAELTKFRISIIINHTHFKNIFIFIFKTILFLPATEKYFLNFPSH